MLILIAAGDSDSDTLFRGRTHSRSDCPSDVPHLDCRLRDNSHGTSTSQWGAEGSLIRVNPPPKRWAFSVSPLNCYTSLDSQSLSPSLAPQHPCYSRVRCVSCKVLEGICYIIGRWLMLGSALHIYSCPDLDCLHGEVLSGSNSRSEKGQGEHYKYLEGKKRRKREEKVEVSSN